MMAGRIIYTQRYVCVRGSYIFCVLVATGNRERKGSRTVLARYIYSCHFTNELIYY